MVPTPALTPLQQQWKALFQVDLPALAKVKDPAQLKWPVQLDHCFARIILDNTVGEGKRQWDQVIAKPAIRTMTEEQLRNAIELGKKIGTGEVNLIELDEKSLSARGKQSKANMPRASVSTFNSEEGQFLSKKRKREAAEAEGTSPKKTKKQATLSFASKDGKTQSFPLPSTSDETSLKADLMPIYKRIQAHPTLTPYRKKLYAALLTVPRGRYTTYAAMSTYLQSSARAVGNGMRNNPFASDVPCHRVLAADGSIGGFHGDWGAEGKYAKEKVELLKKEGVGFDSRGKVKGQIWRGFHELGQEGDGDSLDEQATKQDQPN